MIDLISDDDDDHDGNDGDDGNGMDEGLHGTSSSSSSSSSSQAPAPVVAIASKRQRCHNNNDDNGDDVNRIVSNSISPHTSHSMTSSSGPADVPMVLAARSAVGETTSASSTSAMALTSAPGPPKELTKEELRALRSARFGGNSSASSSGGDGTGDGSSSGGSNGGDSRTSNSI